MSTNTKQIEAARQYATAYEIHYAHKNMGEAFKLYKEILTAYPDTKEAGYAKSQIQNIVNAVVPKEESLRVQMDLAAAAFERAAD